MAQIYKENKLFGPMLEASALAKQAGMASRRARQKNKPGISPTATYPNLGATQPQVGGSTQLGTISTPYGGSTRYEKFHPGVDIANKIGTPINAFAGGKVTEVDTGFKQGDKGFGNRVIVQDAQGNKHFYSHLYKSYVKVGDIVNPGSLLGQMGATGQTYSLSGTGTGSHLDYRVSDAWNKYMNPMAFLNKYKNINT